MIRHYTSTFFAVANVSLFLFAVIIVYTWMSNDVKLVLVLSNRKDREAHLFYKTKTKISFGFSFCEP